MMHGLFELLFPAQCAACGAQGGGLCARCVPLDAPPLHRATETLRVHALGSYEGALRAAILALKDGRRDVAEALGERLARLVPAGALLVPVPTSAARRRVRGVDGVRLVATQAAQRAGARVVAALEHRASDAQRGRSGEQRRAARGRFRCDATMVGGLDVMLLDDVCTTGTTLDDCAAALRAGGARVTQALAAAVANGGA